MVSSLLVTSAVSSELEIITEVENSVEKSDGAVDDEAGSDANEEGCDDGGALIDGAGIAALEIDGEVEFGYCDGVSEDAASDSAGSGEDDPAENCRDKKSSFDSAVNNC